MPIVEYTPSRFGNLKEMVSQVPGPMNLAHRGFVDYYYSTRDWCKLYLYYSDEGKVIGTLGRELAPFILGSRKITIRIASNWYSLRRGIGGELYEHSAKSNLDSVAIMFGGSQKTLDILRHHSWIFMPGIRGFSLNNPYEAVPDSSWWRSATKSVIRHLTTHRLPTLASRLPSSVVNEIAVREEKSYSADLLPSHHPFSFHFTPSLEHLCWRYNLSLPFIRYRLFRVLTHGRTTGFVILSDSPHRIIVAHCDGDNPSSLAYGVLLSILEAGRHDSEARGVFLACSHSDMQEIFCQFGFHSDGEDLPFAFRTHPDGLDPSFGTSNWLVNFHWGDNGLSPAFLDPPSTA